MDKKKRTKRWKTRWMGTNYELTGEEKTIIFLFALFFWTRWWPSK